MRNLYKYRNFGDHPKRFGGNRLWTERSVLLITIGMNLMLPSSLRTVKNYRFQPLLISSKDLPNCQ